MIYILFKFLFQKLYTVEYEGKKLNEFAWDKYIFCMVFQNLKMLGLHHL